MNTAPRLAASSYRRAFAELMARAGVTVDGTQPWDLRVHDERMFRRVLAQGFPGAGDMCLRCHVNIGWVGGRSVPTDGSAMLESDADGVSCQLCHKLTNPDQSELLGVQNPPFIANDGGMPAEGYYGAGQYVLWGGSANLGPYAGVTSPHPTLQSSYHRESELCATCHTLFTHAAGEDAAGAVLPEQVPYLEWRHSAYAQDRSCGSCHMPVVGTPAPIAAVLGQPRAHFSQHTFPGGNFVVPRLLNVHRAELGTEALPQELDAGISRPLRRTMPLELWRVMLGPL